MLPSIKTLERAFPGKGRILRTLLSSSQAVREHPAAQELQRRCYHPPTLSHMRMTALDAEAETHGIEAVYNASKPSYECNPPAFEYLNTGDSYTPTIIRWADGRYRVSSWGDIVERGNYE